MNEYDVVQFILGYLPANTDAIIGGLINGIALWVKDNIIVTYLGFRILEALARRLKIRWLSDALSWLKVKILPGGKLPKPEAINRASFVPYPRSAGSAQSGQTRSPMAQARTGGDKIVE